MGLVEKAARCESLNPEASYMPPIAGVRQPGDDHRVEVTIQPHMTEIRPDTAVIAHRWTGMTERRPLVAVLSPSPTNPKPSVTTPALDLD